MTKSELINLIKDQCPGLESAEIDADVAAQVEEGEFHPRVFRLVTSDELFLSFREVKRQPLTFRKRTDPEDQEANRLAPDVPTQNSSASLLINDIDGA